MIINITFHRRATEFAQGSASRRLPTQPTSGWAPHTSKCMPMQFNIKFDPTQINCKHWLKWYKQRTTNFRQCKSWQKAVKVWPFVKILVCIYKYKCTFSSSADILTELCYLTKLQETNCSKLNLKGTNVQMYKCFFMFIDYFCVLLVPFLLTTLTSFFLS